MMTTSTTRIAQRWSALQTHREEWLSYVFSKKFNPTNPTVKLAGKMDFQAVFMVGTSGSGKGFTKERLYLKHTGFVDIDSDEIKKTHPDYDPNHVHQHVHDWSLLQQEQQLLQVLKTGAPFVYDGTGADYEKMTRLFSLVKKAGYRIFATYVYVPLEVAIYRNRSRTRFVRESILLKRFSEVNFSWPKIKRMADKSKVVVNFTQAQLDQARRNVAAYPPPLEERPPLVD